MTIENEKINILKKLELEHLNLLTNKDKKQILLLETNKFILSGDNEIINKTFNLIKVNNKIISIDVLLRIRNNTKNITNIYIKRFFVKND